MGLAFGCLLAVEDVNAISLASVVGNHSDAACCASQFGNLGLAHVLRLELALQGIDVTVCNPGKIDTPMAEEANKTLRPMARVAARRQS